MPENKAFVLDNRPSGEASTSNFKLVTSATPELSDGEVLVQNVYLSLDPYMRMRMNEGKSYAACQALGEVMIGGTVGRIVESKHPDLKQGEEVVGMGGWQLYTHYPPDQAKQLRRVDSTRVPLSYYLGAVGMPGVTAWIGLLHICKPKPGETVIVSSASGAVGTVVGQLAKAHGCRVLGIAGGPQKCGYVVDELGFDACIDYKKHDTAESLAADIREHAPKGIDCNFENVGGMVLDAIMDCMNDFGRIAVCGFISGYEGEKKPMAQPSLILTKRLRMEGFICPEFMELWPRALKELGELVADGKLKYKESIAEGLEAAPSAFLGMLKGANFGKQLVKLC